MAIDLTARDNDCHAGGHRLRVRCLGQWSADTPVLVFLHEGLGSITQWRDFPLAVCGATGLPALVYDRYGYGQSEPLNEPRPDDFLIQEAHTLADLLMQFKIGKPIIVGHSDGGTIALMVAVRASRPVSMRRSIFSRTTMASSTTMPMARTRPNREILFRL